MKIENMKNNKKSDLELLYELYPVLKIINDDDKNIISEKSQFRTLYAEEQISSVNKACQGILFVLEGNINIKRINMDGEETNLYNIKQGELCHEALSCLLHYNSLNILGTAVQKSKICILSMEIVTKYLLNNSQFLSYMYKDIYEKFSIVIEKREEKNHKSLEARLIELLIKKNSNIIYGTHKELALEIDSSREVVSRKLKDIEKKGYIKLERGKITILKDLHTY